MLIFPGWIVREALSLGMGDTQFGRRTLVSLILITELDPAFPEQTQRCNFMPHISLLSFMYSS